MLRTLENKLIFYLCVHYQLGFQQHQHDFTGCGDFAPEQPTSRKDGLESQKTSAPGRLTALWTSCRCFMVIWCNATIKNLTYCLFKPREFVLPFNIWANYSLRQLHSTISFAKDQQLQTTTQAPPLLSLPVVTSLPIPWWWCHDPRLTQQDLGWNRTREKTLLGCRNTTQETRRMNVNVWKIALKI